MSHGREIASTYHLQIACGSVQGDGDDVVVLVVIRITDGQVLNGQHLRIQHTYGTIDVSSFLIQQGEGEVEEEDSNGSTTVWCCWCSRTPTGLRQARMEEERCWGGEGLRLQLCMQPSPHPSIYRGRGKGGRPPLDGSRGGAAARGRGLAPQARGAPPLGFPQTLGRMGPWGEVHQPTLGWFPSPLRPMSP